MTLPLHRHAVFDRLSCVQQERITHACDENIGIGAKTSTFQFRINPKIRKRVEEIYADCGLTLTEAINIFIQQSINVDGLPFVVTRQSKAAKLEQAVSRLMAEITVGEDSARANGWIDEDDIIAEFGARTAK